MPPTVKPLFIGNCTKQDYDFAYRAQKGGKLIMQVIPVGRQTKLSGDLTGAQITYIIDQHKKYGFVNVKDINRSQPFIGLCYDDKPISVEELKVALAHNDQVLLERGRQTREEASIAAFQSVENQLEGAANLDNFEVTIEEEQSPKTEGEPLREEVSISPRNEGRTQTSKPQRGNQQRGNQPRRGGR